MTNEPNKTDESDFEDIPDADDIQKDSPIDPATPPIEVVHGTDLLNGFHNEDPEDKTDT
jgi:hypothetical protein